MGTTRGGVTMHLMVHFDEDGKRTYTLKKADPEGKPTQSAHPARFSPDDAFSRQRVALKKRFNLLPTQQENLVLNRFQSLHERSKLVHQATDRFTNHRLAIPWGLGAPCLVQNPIPRTWDRHPTTVCTCPYMGTCTN